MPEWELHESQHRSRMSIPGFTDVLRVTGVTSVTGVTGVTSNWVLGEPSLRAGTRQLDRGQGLRAVLGGRHYLNWRTFDVRGQSLVREHQVCHSGLWTTSGRAKCHGGESGFEQEM